MKNKGPCPRNGASGDCCGGMFHPQPFSNENGWRLEIISPHPPLEHLHKVRQRAAVLTAHQRGSLILFLN
ncbi:hypothetical protein EMIT0324P_30040 [Pseudomonas chlororaphis]